MLRKLILILSMAMCTALPAVSQDFAYHPIFALSSGLGFGNNMANETSFMLRNEFATKESDIGTFCPVIGLGYTNRTYHLEYSADGISPFSGPVNMRSLAFEFSLLFRFSAWRRVRKTVVPYVGVNTFRLISKKEVSADEKAFFFHIGIDNDLLDKFRPKPLFFSLETGAELVWKKWPRVNVSIVWELPVARTQTSISESLTGDTVEETKTIYSRSFHNCPRLVVGLRL